MIISTASSLKVANKDELASIIDEYIHQYGETCSLNHIDVSDITDMSELFKDRPFNGDISKWDVSKVQDMFCMFEGSNFSGDISNWDVSNVQDMKNMFKSSQFNGDLSRWNTSKVTNMESLFYESPFNGDISQWNVSNVEFMTAIFCKSPFDGDLSNWHSPNLKGTIYFNKPHWSILGIQSILYMMELNVKMGEGGYVWPSSMPIMPWSESLERIAKLSQELGTPRKDASYIIFNELTHHPVEHEEPIDFNLD